MNRLVSAADARGRDLDAALASEELGLDRGVPTAVTPPITALTAGDRTFLDRERAVWDWPDIGGRLLEELR